MVCVRETDVHVEHISGGQKTTLELALSFPIYASSKNQTQVCGTNTYIY